MRKRDQEADAILDEVTSRTEQFIAMNEKKEAELEKQRKTIEQFERRQANDQLTPDKQVVRKLQDELELAQKNYKALELEMNDATQYMEQNNQLISELTSSNSPEMQIRALMSKLGCPLNCYQLLRLETSFNTSTQVLKEK